MFVTTSSNALLDAANLTNAPISLIAICLVTLTKIVSPLLIVAQKAFVLLSKSVWVIKSQETSVILMMNAYLGIALLLKDVLLSNKHSL